MNGISTSRCSKTISPAPASTGRAHEATGKLDLRRKTFESMAKAWPELEALRQLRHTRDKMRRIKLAVGADGRNRTVLWPFAARRHRARQPKAAQWIFSPAVWLRSLIKPAPGRAIAYIDLSLDGISDRGGAVGVTGPCSSSTPPAVPTSNSPSASTRRRPTATKKTHAEVHERYKVGCLGAQYGMQAETLAQRLGVSTFVATKCSASIAGCSINIGNGWKTGSRARSTPASCAPLSAGHAAPASPNSTRARSAIGRCRRPAPIFCGIACIWAHRRGIELCGPVHDAVLIEAPIDRIEADVALMQEIMRRASRVVLNAILADHELRTDATIVRYPDRYSDKRGQKDVDGSARPPGAVPAAKDEKDRLKVENDDERVFASLQRAAAANLQAGRPRGKARAHADTFVKVPLWWIEQATRATRTPQAFVCIWLLHLSWRARSPTFSLPNDKLNKRGADRRRKRRALQAPRGGRPDHR